MSELRWTLLILGVVFVAALSWWERRRPRQAFAPRLREASLSPHGDSAHGDAHRTASTAPAVAGEPWIAEAGLLDVVSPDMALDHSADAKRSAADSDAHARVETPRPLDDLPTLVIPDEDDRLALQAAWSAEPPEPKLIDPQATVADVPAAIEASAPVAGEPSVPAPEILGAEGVGAVRIVESGPYGDGTAPPEPIVEWPPEESRRILALRLIGPHPERLPGRALRLALAAEGFLLGKFSIFHKPDEANRAVLSAASLSSPGSFDLASMDTQRYGGLSLFVVLPGPKPPPQAFEELLAAARNLNERLQGALQDERGGPLTPLRVASIRESLRTQATTLPAAAAQ